MSQVPSVPSVSSVRSLPSVQSVQLPLHGVRGGNDRYSTVDPIVELRGILEKDFRPDKANDLEVGRAL